MTRWIERLALGPDETILDRLLRLSSRERARLLREMPRRYVEELTERWYQWAHDGQLAPPGDWPLWIIRAGRGFGKTRAGAEWVSGIARTTPDARIALVAANDSDGMRVMIEGPSGLIAVARADESPRWRHSLRELHFDSGAVATLFSAEAPGNLRGPQHDAAWCDELAKWRNGDAAWDNLMLGMRKGEHPRVLVTTTPRPVPLMARVEAVKGRVLTLGRTPDNPHLPRSFVTAMIATYGGTRLGRQELDGEMLADAEGALWSRALIEACRAPAEAIEKPVRVVIGVDPPATSTGDACGIVVAALLRDGKLAVVEDASVEKASPARWAQAVAAAAARWSAERVVAESNMGGEMVLGTLRAAEVTLPVVAVHASVGKARRAEPVALAYERGDVVHAGVFSALEDELCGLQIGGGYAGPGRSPDRADACVWALAELLRGVALGRGPGVVRM